MNLENLVNQILDLSKLSIYPLNEKETYIIRKRFGIYDNEKIQIMSVITNEFNLSGARISTIIQEVYKKFSYRINYVNPNIITREKLLKTDIWENVYFSTRLYNIKRKGIFTLGDLIQLSTSELYRIKGISQKSIEIILEEIHKLGLFFADEVQDFKVSSEIVSKEQEILDNEVASQSINSSYSEILREKEHQLLEKYRNLSFEKEQLELRSIQLDNEINEVLAQLRGVKSSESNELSKK